MQPVVFMGKYLGCMAGSSLFLAGVGTFHPFSFLPSLNHEKS